MPSRPFRTRAGDSRLQMVEPLFMRYIIDRVLLNQALDASRDSRG
jgi:hypothetical protein